MNAPTALVARLDAKATTMHPRERLKALRDALSGDIVFTTQFGAEDQAITHLIATGDLDISIVTIDTGRLFPATYDVWAQTEARYGIRIRPFCPDADALETLVMDQGVNGFYKSVAARKACCEIRKGDPLSLALVEAAGWVTGDREPAATPGQTPSFVSLDHSYKLVKMNPLFDWTPAQALAFARENRIPLHDLQGKGFVSMGCAPCTRAMDPKAPEGACHWWWEDEAGAQQGGGGRNLGN